MVRIARVLGAGLVAAAVASACSKSSTAPPPSIVGTWHVSVGTLTLSGFNPPNFDITIEQNGTAFGGMMPAEGWGGYSFNLNPTVEVHGDSLYASDDVAAPFAPVCAQLGIVGTFNAARDTLRGVAYVAPSTMNSNPAACTAQGPFVATR